MGLQDRGDPASREAMHRIRQHHLLPAMLPGVAFPPRCVGSPLSVKSLSNRLRAAHEMVERWMSVLERLGDELLLCYIATGPPAGLPPLATACAQVQVKLPRFEA